MFEPKASGFCKDEHAKIIKYAYTKSFDQHAPNQRRAFLATIAVLNLSCFLFKDFDFATSLYTTLAVTLAVNAVYIDVKACTTSVDLAAAKKSPLTSLALDAMSFFTPTIIENMLVTAGKKAGEEAANKWNNEESFFQFR
jgi:hypothetical protein